MKSKEFIIGTLAIVAAIFALLLFSERNQNKKLREENRDLGEDKFKLLKESINQNKGLTPEVKNQIENLISHFKSTHPKVSSELKDVLDQIQNGKDIKAIRDLAKIIENLLKEKYQTEPRFAKLKRITLKPLIEHAKEMCLFNDKLYNAACILHQFRNEESHELAVQDSENIKMAALLGGIEIIVIIKAA
ncbi:MAG: hypothetical protein A2W93_00395 [Bacteroidetes bacterium GWF2_43_63]|nr:MAG: hypothetical protein A2W94_13125 [Bacteroidetes bacterium GWE2_42_42]OFY53865.1 MAG: hypothetical protein A2W93_00395 [Bacteroidetes bacterium GWF2_43_63]HBG69823.1 hypothetical protein [Bacteroidales bacterium]HCB60980.1 hypothetical protein [Bacteroidales bacterium]HCY24536.1 hypothetical protein [Bacteroidales bacterium]